MPDQPLPILMVGSSGQVVDSSCYMVRLTPMGRYTRKAVIEWLDSGIDPYIISTESSSKGEEHYHLLIFSNLSEEAVREDVKEFVYFYWPKNERGRGFGNKQYNFQVVEDFMAYGKYLCKDGDIQYSLSINPKFITYCKQKSYKKFDKKTFQTEFESIRDEYKTGIHRVLWFMTEYAKLKAKYRQSINMQHIYQVALSNEFHVRPNKVEYIMREYLEKINSPYI